MGCRFSINLKFILLFSSFEPFSHWCMETVCTCGYETHFSNILILCFLVRSRHGPRRWLSECFHFQFHTQHHSHSTHISHWINSTHLDPSLPSLVIRSIQIICIKYLLGHLFHHCTHPPWGTKHFFPWHMLLGMHWTEWLWAQWQMRPTSNFLDLDVNNSAHISHKHPNLGLIMTCF